MSHGALLFLFPRVVRRDFDVWATAWFFMQGPLVDDFIRTLSALPQLPLGSTPRTRHGYTRCGWHATALRIWDLEVGA